jgi:hypothetical protein
MSLVHKAFEEGSRLTMKLERLPDVLGLQAASLDDPSIYRPAMDVFTSSAQPWDHMDPSVQKRLHAPSLERPGQAG